MRQGESTAQREILGQRFRLAVAFDGDLERNFSGGRKAARSFFSPIDWRGGKNARSLLQIGLELS